MHACLVIPLAAAMAFIGYWRPELDRELDEAGRRMTGW
jgi:hypothetical protein